MSPAARVFTERLRLGPRCYLAADALVRGDVTLGADCTVNAQAALSGRVRCGDGVRIAGHAALIGFNHVDDDPDTPIFRQGVRSRGVEIGDDVWIGANAVVLDGVRVGAHAVVAAGAVVSRDVPPYAVVGGSPARRLRDRREPRRGGGEAERALSSLDRAVRAEWRDALRGFRAPEAPTGWLGADGHGRVLPAARHLCDAVEIAAGFGEPPDDADPAAHVAWLQGVQDPETGLFPDPFQPPAPGAAPASDRLALYNVLAVGYALETLGAAPAHPVRVFEAMDDAALRAWLSALPWRARAWGAGAGVDALATALTLTRRHHPQAAREGALETLFGWLALRVDPVTGLWGSPRAEDGLLQPVNGFYRLTRGAHAQFGLPVPNPEAAIDSVLANRRAWRGFAGASWTACNLLDTIHPLRLCLMQTDHRREEALATAADVIARAAAAWTPAGFAFAPGQPPGLQGTEMWLSVVHLAADMLGLADRFAFVPRGVHRTQAVGRPFLPPALN